MNSPIVSLAAALHGLIDHTNDTILTPNGHIVWCGLRGDVRLNRYGQVDVTLGPFRDIAGCVAEYERVVGVKAR